MCENKSQFFIQFRLIEILGPQKTFFTEKIYVQSNLYVKSDQLSYQKCSNKILVELEDVSYSTFESAKFSHFHTIESRKTVVEHIFTKFFVN